MVEAAAGRGRGGPGGGLPLPDHRARALGRPRPGRRGAVRARALALGLVQARPPRGRAATRTVVLDGARRQARLGRAGPRAPCARAATGARWSRRPSPPSSTPSPPTVRSIVVLLLDGLGDRASTAHGGRTANEAAGTPSLDALAAARIVRPALAAGPGARALERDGALGDPRLPARRSRPGRAVMEALGHGQEVVEDEVLAFAALRYAERRDGALWATGRPGAADPAAPRALAASAPPARIEGLGLQVEPLGPPARPGEGILRVSGGAHDAVTDSDPFFRDRQPVMRPAPLVPEAAATARAAEAWTRATRPPRRRRPRAPVVTLKWWGRRRPAPAFRDRHGLDGVDRRGVAVPRRPRADARHGVRRGPRGRRPRRRAARPARARPPRARRRRDVRLLATSRPPTRPATPRTRAVKRDDDRAHRRAPWPTPAATLRRRGRLRHRRPRDADLARGDPLRRPGAVPDGGPGVRADRVERFGELDCGAGMLGRIGGARRHAAAAERRRPAPLPRLAAHAGARRPGAPADVEPLPLD